MSEVRLSAEARTEFGKGGARRTRRAGKIPAVIYGHGADPRHVSLPAREFSNAIRHGGSNVLLTLEIEGEDQLAIPKAIQRHAIKGTYDHVDLLAVRSGEKVTVDVPLEIIGDLAPGAMLGQELTNISVEAEATHLPTGFEVDITGLPIGAQLTAADVVLPSGTTLATDPEALVLSINEAPTEADVEASIAESAAELGIVETPSDESTGEGGESAGAPGAESGEAAGSAE